MNEQRADDKNDRQRDDKHNKAKNQKQNADRESGHLAAPLKWPSVVSPLILIHKRHQNANACKKLSPICKIVPEP